MTIRHRREFLTSNLPAAALALGTDGASAPPSNAESVPGDLRRAVHALAEARGRVKATMDRQDAMLDRCRTEAERIALDMRFDDELDPLFRAAREAERVVSEALRERGAVAAIVDGAFIFDAAAIEAEVEPQNGNNTLMPLLAGNRVLGTLAASNDPPVPIPAPEPKRITVDAFPLSEEEKSIITTIRNTIGAEEAFARLWCTGPYARSPHLDVWEQEWELDDVHASADFVWCTREAWDRRLSRDYEGWPHRFIGGHVLAHRLRLVD